MLSHGNCSNVNQMASASIGQAPYVQRAPYLPQQQQQVFNNNIGLVGADQFSGGFGIQQPQFGFAQQAQGANPFGLGGAQTQGVSPFGVPQQMGGDSPQAYVADVQGALQQGVIPSLQDLVGKTPQISPNSSEGRALVNQTILLLKSAGPQGEQRAQEYALAQSMFSVVELGGALASIGVNLPPGSPEAQGVAQRMAMLAAVQADMGQQLQTVLSKDPSKGQAIQLPPPQPPPQQQMMGQVVAMMQMMLQMLMQLFNRQPA
jgi:hypothetical protein